MSTTNTTTMDWDQLLWPANCGKCGGAFDCLVENHLSLCADCQKMFADCDSCEMRYDHSKGGNPTRCEDCTKKQFADCDKCGGHFNRLADGHPTRCGVCQALFGVPTPATTTTALAEPTAANKIRQRAPPSKEGYVNCKSCNRHFPPNKRNTGVHCTVCCNREAAKGNNLFARLNMQPPKEVAELLKKAAAAKQQAAPEVAELPKKAPAPKQQAAPAPAPGQSIAEATSAMMARFGGM